MPIAATGSRGFVVMAPAVAVGLPPAVVAAGPDESPSSPHAAPTSVSARSTAVTFENALSFTSSSPQLVMTPPNVCTRTLPSGNHVSIAQVGRGGRPHRHPWSYHEHFRADGAY